MRRAAAAVTASLALLAGCGSDEPDTAGACLAPADSYLSALDRAPDPVTLADDVPISACLVENQPAGELAQVGAAMVEAATRLSAEARRGEDAAALRLGYLIGAAERGAEETGGIHTDLVRRLESAARTAPAGGRAAGTGAAYRRGVAAGRETG